ncbi:MAG TPA: class I SAM-dependent methyltransferase [Candidatus Saccharimonadales bacterium]|nr:class I SAM-dependent methyltransferase [Candidatus Saccharimonadales bacterium]
MIDLPRQRGSEPDAMRIHSNYAQGAPWSVRARFELYDFGRPSFNMDQEAIDAAYRIGNLALRDTVLDVGTSDGNLPDLMRLAYGHQGDIIGIDSSPNQFLDRRSYRSLLFTMHDWNMLGKSALGKTTEVDFRRIGMIAGTDAATPYLPEKDIELWQGFAQKLEGIDDQSIKAAFVMNVFYHLTSEDREKAIDELLRVLHPSGCALFGTSAADNKPRHREGERDVAEDLGIAPPPPMNAGWTTEKMIVELVQRFKHLYVLDYRGDMRIDRMYRAVAYLWSHRSLRNQYTPIPRVELFEGALDRQVASTIRRDINRKGVFLDYIHRTLAIGSQNELAIPEGSSWKQVA